jgi:HAE1 family hydrophobic/amphiphilic exporter-1
MGTAPIAFGIGAGADARRPLGLAVVGGLIFSQMVTLYLTPVFYTYMDTFQGWLEDHFGKVTGKRNSDLADGHVSAD